MTACIEILRATARSITAIQALGMFHAFGEKYEKGFPVFLNCWEPRTDTLFKLVHSGIPRKAVIENQKSFSSNSAARLDPMKRLVSGAENFLCAGTRLGR
jgi:hypothetical protein